jgi:hypothetical protein
MSCPNLSKSWWFLALLFKDYAIYSFFEKTIRKIILTRKWKQILAKRLMTMIDLSDEQWFMPIKEDLMFSDNIYAT